MKNNMTRAEALKNIEELKKYVEALPLPRHPEYHVGQVYKDVDGDIAMVRWSYGPETGVYTLVYLTGAFKGKRYARDMFGGDEKDFTYLGLFNEVFTLKG